MTDNTRTLKPLMLALLALTGCGGGGGGSADSTTAALTTTTPATTTTTDPTSGALSVDAGYGRIAIGGSNLVLAASTAGGAGTNSVRWIQVTGPAVTLEDDDTLTPTLTLPTAGSGAVLKFRVSVTDADGTTAEDDLSVELWVAESASDRTRRADFSANAAWGCTVDPIDSPTVAVTDAGSVQLFESNGIPAHATGTFPNSGNPNSITTVNTSYSIPTDPVDNGQLTEMATFGITLDGVKLERDTAESYSNAGQWNYEAITAGFAAGATANAPFSWLGTDCSNAHVQPTGEYHYHGLPEALINELGEDSSTPAAMILGGYAADGFPFYLRYGHTDPDDSTSPLAVMQGSWEVRSGTRTSGPGGSYDGTFRQDWHYVAGSGDLDECNGRFGPTPEHPEGIYHYYLTDDYPFIPRCVTGVPDASFRTRR
ncbi:MAG: YHYH protein [Pseudomonadota bacterium]